MSKTVAVLVSAILLALASIPASATAINFKVETWHFSYEAQGDVSLQVANADWSQRAFVVFVRGTVPSDRIHYDASSGLVTLTYSIDELHNIQTLLKDSSSVFFNYDDFGGSGEVGYLYSNP